MTSFEVRQAISQGEDIHEVLVHGYIGDYVKSLQLQQNQVVVFDRPIQELKRHGLFREPITFTGIDANGRYTFDTYFDPKAGDPVYEQALIDLLESLEKGRYKIY